MALKVIPIPAPLRGLNTVDPFINAQSGYARELTNYAIINGALSMRPAVRNEESPAGHSDEYAWIDYSSSKWYGITRDANGKIWDITGNSSSSNIGGKPTHYATTAKHASIELLFGLREPRQTVHPFTAWTFTTLGITATDILCGCSHKGILYVTDGSVIEFSDIGQITGAIPTGNTYNFAGQALEGQKIIRMFSMTTLPGNEVQNVLVVVGSGGKVLMFQGDFPTSTNWQIIGNYNMPPAGVNNFVQIDGDIFVASQDYAYWMRDLLSGGTLAAYINSPSAPLQGLWENQGWQSLMPFILPETAFCHYVGKCSSSADESLDVIICAAQADGRITAQLGIYGNEMIYFVYHRKYKAWTIWMMPPFFYPVVQKTGYGAYSASYNQDLNFLDCTKAVDDFASATTTFDIETSWKTPFIAPYGGRNQQSLGIRPVFKNTESGYMHRIQAIYDWSDANTPYNMYTNEQKTEVPPGKRNGFQNAALSNNTYDVYNPLINIGGIGGSVSYQITQKRKASTTVDQTHKVFALSAYISDGGTDIT